MAPISTKRRGEQPNDQGIDEIPVSIFDALRDHPLAGEKEEPQAKEPQFEENSPDLLAQIATLRQQIETMERGQMASLQAPPVVSDPGQSPTLNLEGLPDPVLDAKGYTQGFAQRLLSHQDAVRDWNSKQNEGKTSQSGQLEQLWTDFGETYGDYANADTKQLEFAVKTVTDRAKSRGIDLNRYMLGTRERFFGDVAKEFDRTFGAPGEDNGEDEVDTTPQRRPSRPRTKVARRELGEDNGDGRTAGIFGGSESGGGPARGRQQATPGDMLKDLRDLQVKGGFF